MNFFRICVNSWLDSGFRVLHLNILKSLQASCTYFRLASVLHYLSWVLNGASELAVPGGKPDVCAQKPALKVQDSCSRCFRSVPRPCFLCLKCLALALTHRGSPKGGWRNRSAHTLSYSNGSLQAQPPLASWSPEVRHLASPLPLLEPG